jgi:hypothetical protein
MSRLILLTVLVCVLAIPTAAGENQGPVVEHSLTYSAKGTRSEARHGHLRINDKKIPWGFSRVVAGDQSFSFYVRRYHFGNDGYHFAQPPFFPPDSPEDMSTADLNRGYVLTRERPGNTPADWFYVEWNDGAAFASTDALDQLIEEQAIITVPTDLGDAGWRPDNVGGRERPDFPQRLPWPPTDPATKPAQ